MPRFVASLATQQWPSEPHHDLEVARLLAACRARVAKERGAVWRLEDAGLVLVETVSPSGRFRAVQLSLPIRPTLRVISTPTDLHPGADHAPEALSPPGARPRRDAAQP